MRPEHFTSPSMTSAGVAMTPYFTISSIFSTFSIDASIPAWAIAFSASA